MRLAMKFYAVALVIPLQLASVTQAVADSIDTLSLELNSVQDVGSACRLTFLAKNMTGTAIDKAVFETVIFDGTGGVVSLKLFDFRDLPMKRPRVRQFDLSNMSCQEVGQALINGASTCLVSGAESDLCQSALILKSRVDVELLG
ncbi:hypothetical protein [Tropicibacter sp. Alg240-R139]|uniref:hypothetical protein n=1 Tax=Tropicibacter sp. Alg240-R139 TaxID=2305991 RepID=UPI0013DE7EEB|nr:hypothetical protein [Tropicibacter sp. Alg240-R139]